MINSWEDRYIYLDLYNIPLVCILKHYMLPLWVCESAKINIYIYVKAIESLGGVEN